MPNSAMAILHSDRPGDNTTEARIYDLLAGALDGEWQLWHEPEIHRKEDHEKPYRPDFILLHRRHGLFVLEVKGWRLEHFKDVRTRKKGTQARKITELYYAFGDSEQWVEAPFDQLGKYKQKIRQQLEQRKYSLGLSGKEINTLFDGAVAFANIARTELGMLSDGAASDRLSSKLASELYKRGQRAFYQSEISAWEVQQENVARDLAAANGSLALSPEKLDIIRGIIHPEIRLPPSPCPHEVVRGKSRQLNPELPKSGPQEEIPDELRVLGQAQENVARYEIGSGHRILFGVAGSGKTMILIARARWLAMRNPAHRVLVLCFNRALSLYIARVLEEYDNIDVLTFHAWVRERLGFDLDFNDREYDSKLLKHLREQGAEKFHSILIDECQDWRPDWFKAVLFAAKDPVQGDLLIVGDGSQSIYQEHSDFSWEECGITPQPWRGSDGKVSIIFDRNYRNTPQIVALAAAFARNAAAYRDYSGKGILSLLPDSDECARGDGPKPKLGKFPDRAQEMEFVATSIHRLINALGNLEPCDFAVVYPGHFGVPKAVEHFGDLFKKLNEMSICHDHVQGGEVRNQDKLLEGNSVKILNIKQMKGLEQKVCFVVGVDEYWEKKEEDLLYVAMTRATDWLYLTWSGEKRTSIIDRLKANPSLFLWHESPGEKKTAGSVPQARADRSTITEILDYLNAEQFRCTYGAVAEYLEIRPTEVSQLLGRRRPEVSWIVSKATRMPTGYGRHQIHPDLCKRNHVITSGPELRRLFDSWRKMRD